MSTSNNKIIIGLVATADLCDEHMSSPQRLQVAEPCTFTSFGKKTNFGGPIETIRCFESNPLVRETLGEAGENRVLVVDGGGSKRCAILGRICFFVSLEYINVCMMHSKLLCRCIHGVVFFVSELCSTTIRV
jgi:regulator of RNase E activity RraA